MLVDYAGHNRSILRVVDDFGFESYDLVSAPQRIAGIDSPPLVETNIDKRRVKHIKTPAHLLETKARSPDDN